MKRIACSCILTAVALVFVMTSCAGGGATTTTGALTEPTQTDKTFTSSELAKFNGIDGQPAYVAVDGVVYDVSASALWPEGVHSKCNLGAMAGKDLSSVITQAPANMRSLLERMPVVGRLEQ